MKYKITNKTFSPLQLSGIGIIPARGSIYVTKLVKEFRILEKSNKINIRECKEK